AKLFIIPGLEEIMAGKVAINAMRPVQIEDLLGRRAVHIDSHNVQGILTGKTVLITGAGGSIGSELCRQVAKFSPRLLLLLDASEFALYQIEQWFIENQVNCPVVV